MYSSIQVKPANGTTYTELNDGVIYSIPFPQVLDDQANADLRIQKLLHAAPAYTGKMFSEKTVPLQINILPVPGDSQYLDFETKLNTLRQLFQTRVDDLFTLRVARTSQVPRVALATAKSFTVDRKGRSVTVQVVIIDSIWLSEAISNQNFNITASGQKMKVTSLGTTETFPLFTVSWNVSKQQVNPQGNFYKYQVPTTVTNNAKTAMINFPIDISGYMPPPTFTATAGTGGSIAAGSVQVLVTALRLNLAGATVETNGVAQSVTVSASGSITVVVNTYQDAVGYNIYLSNALQNPTSGNKYSIMQPSPYAATASLTLTSIAAGAAPPTNNATGWDVASLVTAGKMKADHSDIRVLIGDVASPYTFVPPSGSNTCAKLWVLMDLGTLETQSIFIQYGNSAPDAPPPYTDPSLPAPTNLSPILDQTNSNNYSWTWQDFCDYQNLTRPGSWAPVQNVGVGYGWKQDNNIVRRGLITSYGTPAGFTNGDFALGNTTGWTVGTTGATVNTTNPRLGSFDQYACKLPAAGTISQAVTVTPGLVYTISGYVSADVAGNAVIKVLDSDGTTVLWSYSAQGNNAYEDITFSINLLPIQIIPTGTTVTVECVVGAAGNTWIDDICFYPFADVGSRAPLSDNTTDLVTSLGMLHSSVAINNLETPLNGWEISHPAGINKVTHYGITAMVGADYLNGTVNNVLRLVATDPTRPPAVIWGQPALTEGGPVYYATSGAPLVATINPPRARARFEINASVQDANNGDGTFAAVQGVTIGLTPQYGPSMTYSAEQSFYDLNCTITNSNTGDGDSITITTPLEPKANIIIDCFNQTATYTAPDGTQTSRPAAVDLNSLRAFWMQLHPGDNTLTYTEDVVGGVQIAVQWQDFWL